MVHRPECGFSTNDAQARPPYAQWAELEARMRAFAKRNALSDAEGGLAPIYNAYDPMRILDSEEQE
jgi:hypothetical protein